jgi:hypothetical protein
MKTVTLPEFIGQGLQRFGKVEYLDGVSLTQIDPDSIFGQEHLAMLDAAGYAYTLS